MWLVDPDNSVDIYAASHLQQYTVKASTIKCSNISINNSDVKQCFGYGFLAPQMHTSVNKISVHTKPSQAIGYFMTNCDQRSTVTN